MTEAPRPEHPDGAALAAAQEGIVEEFAGLGDWFDRYEHLIALGKARGQAPEGLERDEHALPGCQSQVWIRPQLHDGLLRFDAHSDSLIIQGVLALLLRAVDNRPPDQIAHADLYFLERIGLTTNLSPTRANGVATIVRHIQQCAQDRIPPKP